MSYSYTKFLSAERKKNYISCSVIGAAILGMGYYTVFYGEFKGDDEEENSCDYDESSDSLDKKIPLLQEKMEV